MPVHSRDPFWIKGIVIFIWLMQALEFALSCHMTAVAHSNDSTLSMESIKECLWEAAVYVATCAATECLVHAYFISRIYILGTTNQAQRISMMLCIILMLEGCKAIYHSVQLLVLKNLNMWFYLGQCLFGWDSPF